MRSAFFLVSALALAGCGSPAADADTTRVADYTGRPLDAAKDHARDAGFTTKSHDATAGNAGQWVDGNWKVCFQRPAPGTEAVPDRTKIDFAVTRTELRCPSADGQAVASSSPTASPSASPRMPDVVGRTYRTAAALLRRAGIDDVQTDGAYADVPPPPDPSTWKVCFQELEGEAVTLWLAKPGSRCPAVRGTDQAPAPKPTRTRKPPSAYYPNCAAARAAGAAPVHRGDPGYGRHLDRDGDGVGCDRG
ncbi:excalibur calcium-binding domain-containing protein [Spirillospora sp. CA-294931]|uniref:excalibur calcium-binding domain-containing protein n=1 Tax=Spirillospora sp. CA-294931 TaxID=3240042 RepID=UPI003D9081DD